MTAKRKSPKDYKKFNWFGRSKIYRALTEKAKLSKRNVMELVGCSTNAQLSTYFTYPKKCMTIEDIEKMAYILRNVEGFSIDEILNMIKTGDSVNMIAHEGDLKVLAAKRLYERKKVRKPQFKLRFMKEYKYSDADIEKNHIEGYEPI